MMKKSVKGFSVDTVSKDVASRKKRKGGVLKDGIVHDMVLSGSEADNITEFDSVDMEKEFLIEETSVDYGKGDVLKGKDSNQMPKGLRLVTKQALDKSLGKINFLDNNNDNDIFLNKPVVLFSPLKKLVDVSARKSFALDIDLVNVSEKSAQNKLAVVRKLFSKINGFGGVSTPSKFSGIIRAMFTFKSSLMKATKLAADTKILVNTDLKKSTGTPVNTESARETFYRKLIQNTNLPTNHNFASIITEINKEIEHHTQQRYPITYASKGKGKLQTPAVTPKKIQLLTWKKTRVESPTAPSYHYTLGSAINITSASASTSNVISTFGQFSFQIIVIDQPPVEPIGQLIQILNQQTQQPPPVPPQQQQQQLPSQQQQQMAYTPITKLDKFTNEEDDTQVWLNDVEKTITANGWNDTRIMQAILYFLKDTADSWYQSLVDKLQDFNAFKLEFLRYFSNNNSINRLVNTFTIIKQGETKAVTTYLECFYRNLQQIQAINANYFTVPQILNQFIHGLYSSILQYICSLHPATLQDTVTHARDFESAKLEANHAHAVNLVMNGLSELDSKLK
ncbi:hypothetical protein G9A89_012617 [Geosiphon pyriformis]|nr:hypothetical protein G9A89_012617 [Geosiphon pyriformis]